MNNVCEFNDRLLDHRHAAAASRETPLSIYSFLYPSIRPYLRLSVHPFICPFVRSAIVQPIHLLIHPSANPCICRSIHLSTRPCIYGSISKKPFIHSWVNRINMSSYLNSPFPTSSCLLASPRLYPYLNFAALEILTSKLILSSVVMLAILETPISDRR